MTDNEHNSSCSIDGCYFCKANKINELERELQLSMKQVLDNPHSTDDERNRVLNLIKLIRQETRSILELYSTK